MKHLGHLRGCNSILDEIMKNEAIERVVQNSVVSVQRVQSIKCVLSI